MTSPRRPSQRPRPPFCWGRRAFSLQGNRLGGALPGNWGSAGYWPALKTLRLEDNAFTGPVPAFWTRPDAFPAMRAQGTGM